MLNKTLLQSKLYEKFSNLAFSAIITETFLNALPFNEKDLSTENINDLSTYSKTVIESLGGFNMCKNSTNKIAYSVYDACDEIATEATKRICKEEITGANADKTLPEVVDGAAFTETEYNKFAKNVDTLDIDKVSEIIKDKVIKVIRDEKDSYEKEEAIHDELKDAINSEDAPDEEKKTVESYMDLVLSKNDPHKHITFFSKLQDVSYDALRHTTESYTEIPFKTLTEVTIKNTLRGFKSNNDIDYALESMNLFIADESDNPKIADASLLCAITIYTALESLNSLGLYAPTIQDVQEFMDQNHPCSKCNSVEALESMMLSEVSKIQQLCIKNANTTVLTESLNTLTNFIDKMSDAQGSAFLEAKESITSAINPVLDMIRSKIDSSINKKPAILDSYALRDKDRTIAQFNKINSLFSKNPNVSKICLQFNPAEEAATISVLCKNAADSIVNESFIDVTYKPVFGDYLDFVKESYNASNLKNSPKKVDIYLTDGSGKLVEL